MLKTWHDYFVKACQQLKAGYYEAAIWQAVRADDEATKEFGTNSRNRANSLALLGDCYYAKAKAYMRIQKDRDPAESAGEWLSLAADFYDQAQDMYQTGLERNRVQIDDCLVAPWKGLARCLILLAKKEAEFVVFRTLALLESLRGHGTNETIQVAEEFIELCSKKGLVDLSRKIEEHIKPKDSESDEPG